MSFIRCPFFILSLVEPPLPMSNVIKSKCWIEGQVQGLTQWCIYIKTFGINKKRIIVVPCKTWMCHVYNWMCNPVVVELFQPRPKWWTKTCKRGSRNQKLQARAVCREKKKKNPISSNNSESTHKIAFWSASSKNQWITIGSRLPPPPQSRFNVLKLCTY